MGDRYAIEGQENAAASASAILQITNATTLRGKIYDFSVSASGAMEDDTVQYDVLRFTVAPTDTTVTPRALDPAAPAAVHSDCGENGGTSGTITANTEVFNQGIHVRAAYRWVAVPGGEIVLSAVAANGVVWRALASSYTGTVEATAHFEE